MKAFQIILILCLLACFSSFNFSDFIFCLIEDKNVAKAIEIIVTGIKDQKNAASIAFSVIGYISDLTKKAKECLKE